jgi:hypothetical protein
MSAAVTDLGTENWIFTADNGQRALAIVKDIDAIVYALRECLAQAESEQLRDDLEDVLDLIEFAPVTVKKNGTVKWQSGDFA